MNLVEFYGVNYTQTNVFAPGNSCLEYDCFLLGRPIFRGENVSFREGSRQIFLYTVRIDPIGY